MSTSELLQTPQIIEVIGSTIRVAHPDISNNVRTYLSAQINAAGVAATIQDNHKFEDNDWFVLGEIGDQETETNDVNGAVTRGTSLTVTNALSFDHEIDAPMTRIHERGIAIYGAATDGGVGTLIASIDAKTASGRQLAKAAMIEWNREYTEYTLITTDTTYAYYYAKFIDGVTDSDASNYVLAAGLGSDTVEYFIQQALTMTNSNLDGELLSRKDLVKQANDCQTAIQQFKYQDPRSGEFKQMNWDFEVIEDTTSLTIETGENEYLMSDLTVKPKYESERSIISIRLGSEGKLDKLDLVSYDEKTEEWPRTDCATTGVVGATSLIVDSNVEYASAGTIYSGDNTLTYTGKTGTTTFTGIPATGIYSIQTQVDVDDPVWQGIQFDVPTEYTYFDGKLMLSLPPSSKYSDYPMKIRYFKKLTALTDATSVTEIPFTNVFQYFLASWIERRKGTEEKATLYMQEFKDKVLDNALASSVPTQDFSNYYNFVS